MNFQQPHILWFLFLLIIPLLIHLINFQRTRILAFPGVYRLMQRLQAAQQQKKIQNWLIWLVRTLALLFLILAFALPACNTNISDKRGFDRFILVIDNSLSANVQGTDGTAFDKMKAEIQQFLLGLQSNQLVYVVTQSRDEGTGWLSAPEIASMIDSLECSVQYNGWPQWRDQVERAIVVGESNYNVQRDRTRVMVFTDVEKSSFRGLVSQEQRVKFKNKADSGSLSRGISINPRNQEQWQIIRYPLAKVNNVSIDTAFTNLGGDTSSVPAVKVRLINYGGEAADVSVSLKSQGTILSNKSLQLAANESSIIELPISIKEGLSEKSKGNRKLTGQGFVVEKSPDDFPWDDHLYLHSTPQWNLRIGMLGVNSEFQRLFSVQQSATIETITRPISLNSLRNLQALCLLHSNPLTAEEQGVLKDFMDLGGVVFQLFTDVSDSRSRIAISPFGPLEMKNQAGDFHIDKNGFSHPVFKGAFSKLPDAGTSTPTITHRLIFNDVADFNSILTGENGEILLLQRNWGSGSYWIWASVLQRGSEAWMKSPWVLPVFTEIVSANNKRNFSLYGLVKSETMVAIPGLNPSKDRGVALGYLGMQLDDKLGLLEKSSWIKEWQQELSGMGGVYLGDQPELPGFYSIESDGSRRLLALNYGRIESGLKEVTEVQTMVELLGISDVQQLEYGAVKQATDKSDGNNTWATCLWISVFFLIVEVILQRVKNMSIKQG